ncbi:hypothetical protein C8R46DRAFT_374581 [Mycena filopes]|nr:hypothetical protein C8R46DRAFT_374581 [Mycena filopes]
MRHIQDSNSAALPAHRQTVKFDLSPQFPEGCIRRYPSLTRALANNYPGPVHCDSDDDQSSPASYSDTGRPREFSCSTIATSTSPTLNCGTGLRNSSALNLVPMFARDNVLRDAELSAHLKPTEGAAPVTTRQSNEQKQNQMSEDRCPICGQFFRRPGSLFAHVRRHSQPPGPVFRCETCRRPFLRRGALANHLKTHEVDFCPKPRPRHACAICHRVFLRPSALKTHMNIHYHRQPFRCPLPECCKSFAARSNALRHMRVVHGADAAYPALEVVGVAPEDAADGQYEVKFCPPQLLVDVVVPLTKPKPELRWLPTGDFFGGVDPQRG